MVFARHLEYKEQIGKLVITYDYGLRRDCQVIKRKYMSAPQLQKPRQPLLWVGARKQNIPPNVR